MSNPLEKDKAISFNQVSPRTLSTMEVWGNPLVYKDPVIAAKAEEHRKRISSAGERKPDYGLPRYKGIGAFSLKYRDKEHGDYKVRADMKQASAKGSAFPDAEFMERTLSFSVSNDTVGRPACLFMDMDEIFEDGIEGLSDEQIVGKLQEVIEQNAGIIQQEVVKNAQSRQSRFDMLDDLD